MTDIPPSVTAPDDPAATAIRWVEDGRAVALATVIRTWGSSPRPVGSQMAVDGDGRFEGSVSGGCVEGAVITAALEVLEDGGHRVLEYGVNNDSAWDVGLACGGTIVVSVQRLEPGIAARLAAARAAKAPVALALRLSDGAQGLLTAEAPAPDALALTAAEATEAERLLRADTSGVIGDPADGVFVRAYPPADRLILIGAVHAAQALAPMARTAGFSVTLVDPRTAFATPERFPGVDLVTEWPDEVLPTLGLDRRTAVVCLTHDPKLDDPALIAALRSEAFFVGAIGSRRTHAQRQARLEDDHGLTRAETARIDGPVGLPIGARTPEEIAVSILAGVVKARRRPDLPRVAAIVLAAGGSTRMGGPNKLLAEIDGRPMIAHVVDAALASRAEPVIVVTGHEADRVTAALQDRPVRLAHARAWRDGLSASLRTGLKAVPDVCDGAMICLADMPAVDGATLNRLLDAFRPVEGQAIVAPVTDDRRGNPVIWARRYFDDLMRVTGDMGGRHLLEEYAQEVCTVDMEGADVLTDLDTPEALAAWTRTR